jgi:C1A family cysteine protease
MIPHVSTQRPKFRPSNSTLLGCGVLLAQLAAFASPASAQSKSSSSFVQNEQDSVRRAIAFLKANPQAQQHGADARLLQQADTALAAKDLSALAGTTGHTINVGSQLIELQSPYQGLAELGSSLRLQSDRENLEKYYRLAHSVASPNLKNQHLNPAQLPSIGLSAIQVELDHLLYDVTLDSIFDRAFGIDQPPSAATCAAEKGFESGTDGVNGTCTSYATNGIMRNVSFPLKNDLTCVRNQGRRGTCVAFGVTAAIESAVHVSNGNKVNLSEQHAYWYGETTVGFNGRYTDGLNTADYLQELDASGYQLPREKLWNYNPSWSRSAQSGNTYPNSCVGYTGEECSDFAFQSAEVFDGINYTHPNPMPNAAAFGVSEATEIGTSAGNLDFGKLLLEYDIPLVVAVDVTDSFVFPDADGYVDYNPGEDSRGGHAMEVAGWVENSDLPSMAPAASGGGYFVLKNSWGETAGDCGYYYVPFDYMLEYARSLTAVVL